VSFKVSLPEKDVSSYKTNSVSKPAKSIAIVSPVSKLPVVSIVSGMESGLICNLISYNLLVKLKIELAFPLALANAKETIKIDVLQLPEGRECPCNVLQLPEGRDFYHKT
jgi:hypothetical protein